MNKQTLLGLLSCAALTLACSDDTGTTGGTGAMDSETSATGDGDGDGDSTSDEASTTENMTDDTDMSGDGDGDPATATDTDMTDTDMTGDGDGDQTGDGDGDQTGDGDGDQTGDGDGDQTGDGDGDMNNDVCGDGMVTGDEVCDDGVNDGAYGGCAEDCMAFGPFCGDAEVNGPEACDDANDDSADGCLSTCVVPGSCLEILEFDDAAGDGEYIISPKPDAPWTASCDMTTDGGGWTQLTLEHTCNGDLDSALTAVEAAAMEGVDNECRAFTQDDAGNHTYYWDIEFPPGFDELWLSDDYTLKANGSSANNTSDISGGFFQSSWDMGYSGFTGDVSFGSGDEPGPVTSFAAEGTAIDCFDCEELFPTPMTPFMLGANTAVLRIGWGEGGGQFEGWFPWWAGSIWIR